MVSQSSIKVSRWFPYLCDSTHALMAKEKRLFHRDLSWLGFNFRVLQEADNQEIPLYERIKFLAIFSNNLDEFFRVRVSAIRHLLEVETEKAKAQQLLATITTEVDRQQQVFGKIFFEHIIPALEAEGIHLEMKGNYSPDQRAFMRQFFTEKIGFLLQPVLLVKGNVTPFLQNGAIYLFMALSPKPISKTDDKSKKRVRYSLVRIPEELPRFVLLPAPENVYHIAFIDDIIRDNLDNVFPGYQVEACHAIKLSRDADLHIEDEFSGNLVEKLRKSLNRRKTGAPARFLFDSAMPSGMLDFLKTAFDLKKQELIPGGRYHNFSDFFKFPNPLSPRLERRTPPPLQLPDLDAFPSIFEAIKTRDWLLHFPYQSYDYVLRFLHEAAFDPKVKEIKATQYRVAHDSAVVNALINAARNGKEVTVFVELKARFDEETNLRFAQKMEEAGIRIIYSIPGLKVHAKSVLVTRQSSAKAGARRFAFISTGNFNERTARLYADHGLFTAQPDITGELDVLFLELEHLHWTSKFQHIQVAQFNMVPTYKKLIEEEIQRALQGEKAKIFLKVNNLEEPEMIQLLYQASEAGVEIDVIVRSVCCLIPQRSFSKNIQVRRIVDMYLEHARVFSVWNGGDPRVFIASADWMKRNLHHRIELGVEILAPALKEEILAIYALQLKDNRTARLLDKHLNMHPIGDHQPPLRAQEAIYTYLEEKTRKK